MDKEAKKNKKIYTFCIQWFPNYELMLKQFDLNTINTINYHDTVIILII